MPELIPFQFEAQDVRVHVDDKGHPWWEAQDVCAILDIHDVSKAVARLRLGEKRTSESRNVLIINESGLYRLIFRSNKPEAHRFQDWVFQEVLPTIRKTGQYRIPSTISFAYLQDHRTFLESLGLFEDRDRLLLADIARTQLQRQAGLLPAGVATLPTPQGFDMEDALRAIAPHLTAHQVRKLTPAVGKLVAKEYRTRYQEDPHETTRFVDGKARGVKWYAMGEQDWIYPILQSALAQQGLLTT